MRKQIVLALSLTGCAGASWPEPSTLPGARLLPAEANRTTFAVMPAAGDAIGYSGQVTRAGLEALKRADDGKVHKLLIRSAGGDLDANIALGTWVHERALDVVVVDDCVLTCADYVFPAGAHKTILPGAAVAWTGDAHGASGIEHVAPPAEMARLRAKEDALFTALGVNECLCRVGDERGLDWGRVFSYRRQVAFFTLSVEDMARFGVRDVEGDPKNVNRDVRRWLDLTFVDLPRDLNVQTACR